MAAAMTAKSGVGGLRGPARIVVYALCGREAHYAYFKHFPPGLLNNVMSPIDFHHMATSDRHHRVIVREYRTVG